MSSAAIAPGEDPLRRAREMPEYKDADGNPCSLDTLCQREPAWAANQIRRLYRPAIDTPAPEPCCGTCDGTREVPSYQGEYAGPCPDCRTKDDEIRRLTAWLARIEGGDNPCTDESQLRQWAYEANTLRNPAGE